MNKEIEIVKEKSVFNVLSSINVNEFVEKKGAFKYLSWSDAVSVLLDNFPDATWSHREWDNMPYLTTATGCFVEASVTINSVTRKQLHPILDFKNQSVLKPNSMQVNSSIQRAITKAIGLHGLGLYIYRGEDLPPEDKQHLVNELIALLKSQNKFNEKYRSAITSLTIEQLNEKLVANKEK